MQRGGIVVRRQVLEPGEATPWHVDPQHRVTVVLTGDTLRIEYKDGGEPLIIAFESGQADWDEPSDRSHRAVNLGSTRYEEIAVFLPDGTAVTKFATKAGHAG